MQFRMMFMILTFPEKLSWLPGSVSIGFSDRSSEPKKTLDEKLCGFVVVSPAEPSLTLSYPFDVFLFYFASSFPVSCLNPFGKVFTKFVRRPYVKQQGLLGFVIPAAAGFERIGSKLSA